MTPENVAEVKEWVTRWITFVGVRRIIIGVVSLGVGSVGAWMLVRPSGVAVEAMLPRASDQPVAVATSTVPATVKVHVAGAVARPGVYQLSSSARVIDAVSAAGGPTSRADLENINLAQTIVDSEQVYVPSRGSSRPTTTVAPRLKPNRRGDRAASGTVPQQTSSATQPGTGAIEPAARINLNTATASQLDTLPGVGPTTARAIIAYRNKHGPFSKVEDLLNVSGIGPSKLSAMRDRVTL